MIDTYTIRRDRSLWPLAIYIGDGRVENVTFDGIGGTLYARTQTQSLWYCNLPFAGEWITVGVTRSENTNDQRPV